MSSKHSSFSTIASLRTTKWWCMASHVTPDQVPLNSWDKADLWCQGLRADTKFNFKTCIAWQSIQAYKKSSEEHFYFECLKSKARIMSQQDPWTCHCYEVFMAVLYKVLISEEPTFFLYTSLIWSRFCIKPSHHMVTIKSKSFPLKNWDLQTAKLMGSTGWNRAINV